MEYSHHLKLPLIQPSQAQKHVTHNEALTLLDRFVHLAALSQDQTAPPSTPQLEDQYIVPVGAIGDWENHQHEVATFNGTDWAFQTPQPGWCCWVVDNGDLIAWTGSAWKSVNEPHHLVSELGIGTPASSTNRLAVAADASLFTHAGSHHRAIINKQGASDVASLGFQTDYSGRAELGLVGDNNLHFRVSPDGLNFKDAIVIDQSSATASFPSGLPYEHNKNWIINGDFQLWQRGINFNSASGFCADRIRYSNEGGSVTREPFAPGQVDVPGEPEFFMRHDMTTATSQEHPVCLTRIEDVRSLASKPCTVSLYGRSSPAPVPITLQLRQHFGSGGSSDLTYVHQGAILSASWEKQIAHFQLGSLAGLSIGSGSFVELSVIAPVGTSAQIDCAKLRLEIGNTATEAPSPSLATLQTECQRYFQKSYDREVPPGTIVDGGSRFIRAGAEHMNSTIHLFTPMRTAPSVHIYSRLLGTIGKFTKNNSDVDAFTGFPSEKSFVVYDTSEVIDTQYSFHWTAEAEL